MSHEDKSRVLHQLGNITFQLSQLRFDRIGSLFEGRDGPVLKTALSRGLLVRHRHSLPDVQRGPFVRAADYYSALVSAFQEHATTLPLSPHCFFAPCPQPEEYDERRQIEDASDRWHDFVLLGSKLEGSDNILDYIMVGDLLAEMRLKWAITIYPDEVSDGVNSLHHPDISVNNVYIDKAYNITCIIDWAFCSAVPLSTTLTAPGLPQSRDEISEQLFAEFDKGFQEATYNRSQCMHPKEGALLRHVLHNSRPMWLFLRLANFETITDYRLFRDLWGCMYQEKRNLLMEFRSRQSWEPYLQLHAELKEEECPDETAERENFDRRTEIDLTVARKLTLVSQWSSRYCGVHSFGLRSNSAAFVADKTLWNWIDQCLQDLHENSR